MLESRGRGRSQKAESIGSSWRNRQWDSPCLDIKLLLTVAARTQSLEFQDVDSVAAATCWWMTA